MREEYTLREEIRTVRGSVGSQAEKKVSYKSRSRKQDMAYALRYERMGTGWAAAPNMHEYMATPSRVLDVS